MFLFPECTKEIPCKYCVVCHLDGGFGSGGFEAYNQCFDDKDEAQAAEDEQEANGYNVNGVMYDLDCTIN